MNIPSSRLEAEIEIDMSPASVSLIMLVQKTDACPLPPYKLIHKGYTGLNGEKMILLKWQDDHNSNILSYDVHYRSSENEEFIKINPTYLRDRSYIHLLSPESTGGEYKIKSIDYWGRESEFSDVLQID